MFSARTNWNLSPNRFAQAVEQVRASGAAILDLTVSNPTECDFRYDGETVWEAFRNRAALCYEAQPKGLLAAREQVARYYSEDHGISVDPGSIFLTTSTSEAYSYVFRLLCNPQDELLVPKPSYPLFEYLADLQDVVLVPYALEYAHGWFVDLPSVVRSLSPRTRAILLVHPNNPTGSYLRADEVTRLNDLCRQRDLALIVDEVFLDYAFAGGHPRSFVANVDALTFTLSGLSKIAALPQMKVAWVTTTGPRQFVRTALDRLEIIADTYLSLNTPTQGALAALLEQRRLLQPQLKQRIEENRALLGAQLSGRQNWQLLAAEGGWYAVLRGKGEFSEEEFVIELLRKHRVLLHPGHFYDFAQEGHLVLSLITPGETFREGIRRLLGT